MNGCGPIYRLERLDRDGRVVASVVCQNSAGDTWQLCEVVVLMVGRQLVTKSSRCGFADGKSIKRSNRKV